MRDIHRRLSIAIPMLAAVLAIAVWGALAWHVHVIRTRVADATRAVDAAELVVMEAATVQGGLDQIRSAALAEPAASAWVSPYVASVRIGDGGRITLTTRNTGSTTAPVLQFVPQGGSAVGQGDISWQCFVLSGDASLAPSGCAQMPGELAIAPATAGTAPAAAASAAQ